MPKQKKILKADLPFQDELDRAVGSERLKELKERKKLDDAALEDLGTALIQGSISVKDAAQILDKKEILPPKKQAPLRKSDYRILEDENMLKIVDKDGFQRGHLLYNFFETGYTDVMFIHEVLINDENRGNGYGTELMQRAEKVARREGLNAILLEVDRHNGRAIDFYEDLGYVEVGGNTSGNVDRLVMRKDLLAGD